MREILFRGFHEDKNGTKEIVLNGKKIMGKWVYGDLMHTSDELINMGEEILDAQILIGEDIFNGYFVLPETVGQYVGLTDKNGKKIFEGDIVKVYVNVQGRDFRGEIDDNNSFNGYKIGVIKFCPSLGYYIQGISKYDEDKDITTQIKTKRHITAKRSEVIGNIYETKQRGEEE